MKGKTARARKAIECPPVCPAPHREIVFSLVQKHSRLLAAQQIGLPTQAIHFNVDVLRNCSGKDLHFSVQVLLRTYWNIIPGDDPSRLEQFLQDLDDLVR